MNNVGEKFLPVGSVVLLKGGKKRLFITGFCSASSDGNDNKVFDYSGALYPEGLLVSTQAALFNHSQIEKVFHVGFSDEEEHKFKERLKNALDLAVESGAISTGYVLSKGSNASDSNKLSNIDSVGDKNLDSNKTSDISSNVDNYSLSSLENVSANNMTPNPLDNQNSNVVPNLMGDSVASTEIGTQSTVALPNNPIPDLMGQQQNQQVSQQSNQQNGLPTTNRFLTGFDFGNDANN